MAVRRSQLSTGVHPGVQLLQSAVGPAFWELAEPAFRPIGTGSICLGAVE